MIPTEEDILLWLEDVKDPEIPILSLVDLGVITRIEADNDQVMIELTPTFVGCPALDYMVRDIENVLTQHGIKKVHVEISFKISWTSDRISAKGREDLKKFGLAPPPISSVITDIDILDHVACPRCGSHDTQMKNPFGPTLCRAIYYCSSCREAFELFKPL